MRFFIAVVLLLAAEGAQAVPPEVTLPLFQQTWCGQGMGAQQVRCRKCVRAMLPAAVAARDQCRSLPEREEVECVADVLREFQARVSECACTRPARW